MKREQKTDSEIKRIMKGRAARILAVAVSVFLCALTLFEYVALRMEWDVPALAVISGDNGFWSGVYQKEELAFDDSTENILLTDVDNAGIAAAKRGDNAERQDDAAGISGGGNAQADDNAQDEPEFPYYIRINRKQNCITVYTLDDEGEYTIPYKAMICSTGLYNATPRGTYQISTKYLWRELYGGVYGQYATRIHGGVLFHSVPYYSRSKNALCTDKYNKLGQQASMGCVRLTVEDAKWIAENCPQGTMVEIYDDDDPGPLGKPEAVKIDTDSPNKGWDPTDPDENNPWHELSRDE